MQTRSHSFVSGLALLLPLIALTSGCTETAASPGTPAVDAGADVAAAATDSGTMFIFADTGTTTTPPGDGGMMMPPPGDGGMMMMMPPPGDGGMMMPRSCTSAADCTGACPPGARGCTCGSTPMGQTCVPTCTASSDCPVTPMGMSLQCRSGICAP